MFQLGDVELCLGGLNPPKHPRGDGTAWAALSKSVKFLNTNSNTATKNMTRNPTFYGVHNRKLKYSGCIFGSLVRCRHPVICHIAK